MLVSLDLLCKDTKYTNRVNYNIVEYFFRLRAIGCTLTLTMCHFTFGLTGNTFGVTENTSGVIEISFGVFFDNVTLFPDNSDYVCSASLVSLDDEEKNRRAHRCVRLNV